MQNQDKDNNLNFIKEINKGEDGENGQNDLRDNESNNSDDFLYTTVFKPYQLKNKLKVQKIEEVQFDVNDEDTFIL